MNIIAAISIFLVVLIFLRKLQQKKSELIYKYRLYFLRDKLRMLAIDEKASQRDWFYSYLDKSLTLHLEKRRYTTLFYLFALNIKHSGEKNIILLKERVIEESEKHLELKNILDDFQDAHIKYILDQHKITFFAIIRPALVPITLIAKLTSSIREALYYPEVTPTQEYA